MISNYPNRSTVRLTVALIGSSFLVANSGLPSTAQTATSNQTGSITNSLNSPIFQSNPQNQNSIPINNQNSLPVNNFNTTSTDVNVPNIYPLQNLPNAYVNTENDFGMNLSAGVNTLDSSNVTVYLGLIFQPGRTASHKARMKRLQKETELLEANLSYLQTQIETAKFQLEQLKNPASP
jgi:hypothetical protein